MPNRRCGVPGAGAGAGAGGLRSRWRGGRGCAGVAVCELRRAPASRPSAASDGSRDWAAVVVSRPAATRTQSRRAEPRIADGDRPHQRPVPLRVQLPRELLVLVHGDEIDAGANRRAPAGPHRVERAEVVARAPAARCVGRDRSRSACRSGSRGRRRARALTAVVSRCSSSGVQAPALRLPLGLDLRPRVVPPAPVIRSRAGHIRRLPVHGAEQPQRAPAGSTIAKSCCCASCSPVSTSTGASRIGCDRRRGRCALRRAQPGWYSPSSFQTAAWCSGSSDLKSRLRVMIGQSSRRFSCSAFSTIGRIRSKRYSRMPGSRPVNGSPWLTIERPAPVAGSRYQNRSCSIASGQCRCRAPDRSGPPSGRSRDRSCARRAGRACRGRGRRAAPPAGPGAPGEDRMPRPECQSQGTAARRRMQPELDRRGVGSRSRSRGQPMAHRRQLCGATPVRPAAAARQAEGSSSIRMRTSQARAPAECSWPGAWRSRVQSVPTSTRMPAPRTGEPPCMCDSSGHDSAARICRRCKRRQKRMALAHFQASREVEDLLDPLHPLVGPAIEPGEERLHLGLPAGVDRLFCPCRPAPGRSRASPR